MKCTNEKKVQKKNSTLFSSRGIYQLAIFSIILFSMHKDLVNTRLKVFFPKNILIKTKTSFGKLESVFFGKN